MYPLSLALKPAGRSWLRTSPLLLLGSLLLGGLLEGSELLAGLRFAEHPLGLLQFLAGLQGFGELLSAGDLVGGHAFAARGEDRGGLFLDGAVLCRDHRWHHEVCPTEAVVLAFRHIGREGRM